MHVLALKSLKATIIELCLLFILYRQPNNSKYLESEVSGSVNKNTTLVFVCCSQDTGFIGEFHAGGYNPNLEKEWGVEPDRGVSEEPVTAL